MARITTSHAVADRNRRFASELPRIRGIPGSRGRKVAGRSCPTKTPVPVSGQASSSSISGAWCGRRGQEIAQPSDGLDDVDVQLLADTADKDLDGVRVAVEILVVEMFDQL